MGISFNEQFDQHGAWRRDFALRLKQLGEWTRTHRLADTAVQAQLQRLEAQVRADKVTVAFVAEFSRGKSELINALFFAGYGRRIMPAAAGRTTMCPTELGYEPELPACLRLLPVQTRLQPLALAEWREQPEQWTHLDLDLQDPEALAATLEMVSEVIRVSQDEARALGFWHDDDPQDNPLPDAAGLIEIPRWRHALINLAHPLLEQGLVILDTPGLNAVGAEPELTVSLIPQAHAVVFILAADAGVTRSDLAMWREHLSPPEGTTASRLVVLNKIDTLWDALSSPEQIESQIQRQRAHSAEMLGVPEQQVLAVSAQKGLVAKVSQDAALLAASRLPALEDALGQGLLGQRRAILQQAVSQGVGSLRLELGRVFNIRRRDLAEQMLELNGLHGKNASVIHSMRLRIEQEQGEFDESHARVQAVKSVHLKLQREALHPLSTGNLKLVLTQLTQALRQPGFKLGVRRAYGDAFAELRRVLASTVQASGELQSMLASSFKQFNAEYGFSLQVPNPPDMSRYEADLARIESGHLQYLTFSHALKLAQPAFAERLVRALGTRLRVVLETASSDLQTWSHAAVAQMDSQVRERRRSFIRRLEAIDRIQQAASSLAERIAEIEASEAKLQQLEKQLCGLTDDLLEAVDQVPARPPTETFSA
ncbi:dynamin family protein [Curvibacter sp. HBC28]|uniref:Dynamin family protein n=1 Tax=Curvibacter microcysteis TaxID=3026419 RepID=A0ABT5MJ11_9BURK|nr:dynamin family protein [Curvibacter sp. HBC28]MDD0816396.1 dynamin family protein [Curvibacter sp. HBC28]